MKSEWRPIPNFPNYEISSDGRVRRVGIARGKTGGELASWLSAKDGYKQVGLCSAGTVHRKFIHRLVAEAFIGPPNGLVVDHINGERSDNRLENIRYATPTQNAANSRTKSSRTSRFKGVCYDKERGRWMAFGSHKRRTIALGRFASEGDAAAAYNTWAANQYGEFARLNDLQAPDLDEAA